MPHFSPTMSKRELRQEFRKLSLRLHPDKGGDEEEFKTMMEEYEKTLQIILKIVEEQGGVEEDPDDPVFQEMEREFLRYKVLLQHHLKRNSIALIKPHQEDGVSWLMKRELLGKGGLLCDDMGLGKTMQMCALIVGIPKKLTLIVVPPVIINQWREALERVTRVSDVPFRILVFTTKDRSEIYKQIIASTSAGEEDNTHFVVVSSYNMLIPRDSKYARPEDCKPRLGFVWNRVILDEVHYIRNKKSKSFGTINNIRCSGSRWGLTGTPVNNRVSDIQAILHTVLRNDCLTLHPRSEKLKVMIKQSVLRRTKESLILKDPLPNCDVVNVHIPFESQAEIDMYHVISRNVLADLNEGNIEDIQEFTFQVFEQLIRMRQATTDMNQAISAMNRKQFKRRPLPEWHETPTPRFPKYVSPLGFGCEVGNNSKINYLLRDITNPAAQLETSLIFCHFRSEIAIYEKALSSCGLSVGRIDGSVSKKKKEELLDNFVCSKYDLAEIMEIKLGLGKASPEICDITNMIHKHHSYDAIIIQIECGGTGLNLQAATRIYITSPHYNPAIELQSIARAHRIGQKQKVVVKRLLMSFKENQESECEETIDTHIVSIQNKKVDIMTAILEDESYRLKTRTEFAFKK